MKLVHNRSKELTRTLTSSKCCKSLWMFLELRQILKWADKSTTSYDMLDFKSYIKNLTCKYLVNECHMLKLQGILLQYLKLD